jgi:hypothetical protein
MKVLNVFKNIYAMVILYNDTSAVWTVCFPIPVRGKKFFSSPKHSGWLWDAVYLLFNE